MEKSRPFTLRISGEVERWLEREARRSRLSKGALLEMLAEESIRTRRFPGIAFRGAESDRRAWLIGTGFDVWEVVQAYEESDRETVISGGRLSEPQLDLALAYHAEHQEEIDEAVAENRESLGHWRAISRAKDPDHRVLAGRFSPVPLGLYKATPGRAHLRPHRR